MTLSKLILSSGAVIALVAGCATAPDGSLRARVTDIMQPGARQEAKQASAAAQRVADDARCRQLGFKPGSHGYGNCRLQLEQIHATRAAADDAANEVRRARNTTFGSTSLDGGRKVYDASECIGPVIMGECKGSILPNKADHPTCHGAWINGQCTGPMF